MKKYDKMYKVAEVLKVHFQNLSALKLLDISREILLSIEEIKE